MSYRLVSNSVASATLHLYFVLVTSRPSWYHIIYCQVDGSIIKLYILNPGYGALYGPWFTGNVLSLARSLIDTHGTYGFPGTTQGISLTSILRSEASPNQCIVQISRASKTDHRFVRQRATSLA